jgi:hypothetical protein
MSPLSLFLQIGRFLFLRILNPFPFPDWTTVTGEKKYLGIVRFFGANDIQLLLTAAERKKRNSILKEKNLG